MQEFGKGDRKAHLYVWKKGLHLRKRGKGKKEPDIVIGKNSGEKETQYNFGEGRQVDRRKSVEGAGGTCNTRKNLDKIPSHSILTKFEERSTENTNGGGWAR